MTTENSQLVSAKQLAKMLSTSVRSVWRYRASGHLPKTVKISGAIRWKMSDIELFLECDCDMAKFQARKAAEQC
ncbi:MAG: helix-turn-helix domain-containing protein [Phycisphaerae bacterium]|nr:helix-turn-helix domain-containing protein [Phycisphaerae bacterium]NIP50421.1 helix-turn-helix domain-containing protein [Phycisphaerae bacterium]NIS49549.1 helix-turn-helix domain-containing protein [Phycisphaerae bacterium]NIU07307.1 helix-turn-helix domain-containing protein [Phycisphaerae bacterium]NIU54876.1 helix-turn-helix domain-containing protein [Phycisphaerae bacterium]